MIARLAGQLVFATRGSEGDVNLTQRTNLNGSTQVWHNGDLTVETPRRHKMGHVPTRFVSYNINTLRGKEGAIADVVPAPFRHHISDGPLLPPQGVHVVADEPGRHMPHLVPAGSIHV